MLMIVCGFLLPLWEILLHLLLCASLTFLGGIEPVDQYLRTFSWNKVKYRADRSLGELIDLLEKVGIIHFCISCSFMLTFFFMIGSSEY